MFAQHRNTNYVWIEGQTYTESKIICIGNILSQHISDSVIIPANTAELLSAWKYKKNIYLLKFPIVVTFVFRKIFPKYIYNMLYKSQANFTLFSLILTQN